MANLYYTFKAQVRNGTGHIQFSGPQVNREYGMAFDLNVIEDIEDVFMAPKVKSLATNSYTYVPGTFTWHAASNAARINNNRGVIIFQMTDEAKELVKQFAEASNKLDVPCQFKPVCEAVHVQFPDGRLNRPYGLALDITVNSFVQQLWEYAPKVKSLATGKVIYAEARFLFDGKNAAIKVGNSTFGVYPTPEQLAQIRKIK